jgi:hypothetical protein
MRARHRQIAIAIAIGLSGCAAAPQPLRYVAVQMPNQFPPPLRQPRQTVEVSHTHVLPSVRLPVDVAGFVGELEHKAGVSPLLNADVNLTTAVCFLLCVNTDRATAEVGP